MILNHLKVFFFRHPVYRIFSKYIENDDVIMPLCNSCTQILEDKIIYQDLAKKIAS